MSYGDRKFKVKSKLKTKTTHPIWHDLFELYETTRNGLQLTFFSAVDSKHPQPLLISVVEKDKKLNPWTTKIDTQRLSKLNHTWRESWEPLKDNGSGPSKPHIKIRLKVCGGSPLKKPAKVAAPAAPRKQTDGKGNQKKASGFSLSPLVQLIKDDDSLGLEDYLLTITPEEINRQHPKNGNTALHEACIEKREAALPLLLQVPFKIVCTLFFCSHTKSVKVSLLTYPTQIRTHLYITFASIGRVLITCIALHCSLKMAQM